MRQLTLRCNPVGGGDSRSTFQVENERHRTAKHKPYALQNRLRWKRRLTLRGNPVGGGDDACG
ncbi:hypothetical protein Pla52n_37050 [Stieleria varia]|uniref:Uncharacterized protein n=1 Tax=Stieleria varia TaxID=2528005 RepID=A0A5C6ASX6_9BACT|nr:hypothetical protein Pla52n_37050 [Stieleria varia]